MLFLLFLIPLTKSISYPNNSVQISRSPYLHEPSSVSHCNARPLLGIAGAHRGYCESGWTYYNETDACYKNFFSATFDGAESVCITVGGHLTSIHSYKENAFVAELAKSGKTLTGADDTTWIGLVRSDHLDSRLPVKWMWTDGTAVDYLEWTPDHPGAERCVLLWSDPHVSEYTKLWYRKWANYPCRITVRTFVCKKMACYFNA
ncbi:unnamed protein product [Cylicocyclus nassatus]|uniref:C-type lectin domain-containing protein n=1 Tax=Cylicocyclus nassatus TaxID=53992 RepID=A0AA36H1J5_CYLNA|nr:unnamed protein product [Cylicocyclus nassatus]